MNSFMIFNPTRIFFGVDQAVPFATAVARLGKRALLLTGGGTVERLGIQKQVVEALTSAGVQLSYFAGVEPNPEAATVDRAATAFLSHGAQFVVALGGGSVIDAAKAVAALAFAQEPHIWPFVVGEPRASQLKGAVPIVAIPTTAATASEVTPYAIISNRQLRGKSILSAEFLKCSVSWLNPAFTVGLSAVTTRDGAADIFSHVVENYIVGGPSSPMADRYSEGVMLTVLEMLPLVLAAPHDLNLRGNLQWAATLALNGYQSAGRRRADFVLHSMEHGLSAWRPELAHGRGLATLYPAYFRWLIAHGRGVDRLAELGRRLFGASGAEDNCARVFVEKFEQWLAANDLLQSLGELGFDERDYPAIAAYSARVYGNGTDLDALGPLPQVEIVNIFRATEQQAAARRRSA